MCAQRIQRLIQASILGIVMALVGGEFYKLAFLLQFGMMFMLFVAGLTGWCPGLIILKKIFPPCKCENNETTKDMN